MYVIIRIRLNVAVGKVMYSYFLVCYRYEYFEMNNSEISKNTSGEALIKHLKFKTNAFLSLLTRKKSLWTTEWK